MYYNTAQGAVWLKRQKIVTLLVERGANVNLQTSSVGYFPLHYTAKLGLLEVAELLLANGAEVNAQAKLDAETPLHYAVLKGNLEMVELLIEWGANVNSRSSFGATPLSNARGNRAMTALLLARGATDYGWQD
ncbi:MAG: ankyrin repeat domain-containing protein [Cyanobacteriota bacterium]|nr:ankyrin repeat domain-containing protein [Cyanobacteriota bacterium]